MQDTSLSLARVAAAIVCDVMGPGLTGTCTYSSDGNHILMQFDGYPFYGSTFRRRGAVYVQIPRNTFYLRRSDICFTKLQQAQCRYYQEKVGTAFKHPHVFESGQPCWQGGERNRAVDLIANICETLALNNVTNSSVTIGLCASGCMGTGADALRNARKHQQTVMETLGSKPMVCDRAALETYIGKRWAALSDLLARSVS
ncbi:MAG: hypothetical protein IIY00_05160 [Clostridia bacterium]|nr:hypothetical protein [Clostridia bacterium]